MCSGVQPSWDNMDKWVLWCGKFARRYSVLSGKPKATCFLSKRADPPSVTFHQLQCQIWNRHGFILMERVQLLSLIWSCWTFIDQLTCQCSFFTSYFSKSLNIIASLKGSVHPVYKESDFYVSCYPSMQLYLVFYDQVLRYFVSESSASTPKGGEWNFICGAHRLDHYLK